MKKNTVKALIAALVVTSGVGAGAIAFNAGKSTASETAAIERSLAEEALYSKTADAVVEQLAKVQRAAEYEAKAEKLAAEKKAAEEKAAADKAAAEKKAAEEKAAADKAAAEKKAAEEQKQREEEAKKRKEEEEAARIKKLTEEKKAEIMKAVKEAKAKDEKDGVISKEDAKSIKKMLKEAKKEGLTITFTDKDLVEMKLLVSEFDDLGMKFKDETEREAAVAREAADGPDRIATPVDTISAQN